MTVLCILAPKPESRPKQARTSKTGLRRHPPRMGLGMKKPDRRDLEIRLAAHLRQEASQQAEGRTRVDRGRSSTAPQLPRVGYSMANPGVPARHLRAGFWQQKRAAHVGGLREPPTDSRGAPTSVSPPLHLSDTGTDLLPTNKLKRKKGRIHGRAGGGTPNRGVPPPVCCGLAPRVDRLGLPLLFHSQRPLEQGRGCGPWT